jgi:hypothetical protein
MQWLQQDYYRHDNNNNGARPNYRFNRRYCSNCCRFITRQEYAKSDPWCPNQGCSRKLRIKPRRKSIRTAATWKNKNKNNKSRQ